jgi:hypothetical protein
MLTYRKYVGQVVLVLLAAFGVFLSEVRAQHPVGGMMPGGGMPGSRGSGGMMSGGGQMPGGTRMPAGSATPSTYGYGRSAGGYGGYGDASGGYSGGGAEMTTTRQGSGTSQSPGRSGSAVILTASGVPNDGGQVRWPLGLRLLGSEEAEALRQQTEALFQVAARQAQRGQSNPRLTRELTQAVNDLRGLLRQNNDRSPLPWGAYQDAERFLNRLKKAPELLEQALTAPAGGHTAASDDGQRDSAKTDPGPSSGTRPRGPAPTPAAPTTP